MLHQYILEEEAKETVFDWIRDFKDYEIRRELQAQIDSLRQEVKKRDQKVSRLQLRLEEVVMQVDVDHERQDFLCEASFQSV